MGEVVTGALGLALGVAVGLPPLVAVCVEYYDAAKSYMSSKKELAELCPLFGWEHKRFSDWQAQASGGRGYDAVSDDDPAIENLTIACLEQIQLAFVEAQQLSEGYGMRRLFDWSARRVPLTASIENVSQRRRIAWALAGSRNAETLCKRLKGYNDMLDAIWKRSRAAMARRILPELDGFNNTDGLRLVEDALKREDDPEYRELASSVRLRRLCLEAKLAEESRLASGAQQPAQSLDRSLELRYGDFPSGFVHTLPQRTTTVRDKRVILEWKSFPRSPPPTSAMNQYEYDRVVSANVQGLGNILAEKSKPWRLKALNCVGHHQLQTDEPETRVCFAFELPAGPPMEIVSLQDLIEGSQSYREGRYRLGDQFILAESLASSVYQLLFAGWLHKGIRSSSIYFLKSSAAADRWQPDPRGSYLMGYQLARLTNTVAASVKPDDDIEYWRYIHPDYLEGRSPNYQPQHDVYSLGMVLIEIALWKTTRQMAQKLKRPSNDARVRLEQFQIAATEILIPMVEERAGLVYADVVRFCLQGTSGDVSDLPRLLKQLDREVVAKLEKCYA